MAIIITMVLWHTFSKECLKCERQFRETSSSWHFHTFCFVSNVTPLAKTHQKENMLAWNDMPFKFPELPLRNTWGNNSVVRRDDGRERFTLPLLYSMSTNSKLTFYRHAETDMIERRQLPLLLPMQIRGSQGSSDMRSDVVI